MKCSECKSEKSLSEFYKNSTKKLRTQTCCKECDSMRSQNYYEDNSEESIEYSRKYRNKDRDEDYIYTSESDDTIDDELLIDEENSDEEEQNEDDDTIDDELLIDEENENEDDEKIIKEFDKETILKDISKIEQSNNIKLNLDQMNCINMILNNNISLITGGPGTGKSTLVSFLVSCNKYNNNFKWCILTPTGKAAARFKNDKIINQVSNNFIYTIHSLYYKLLKSKFIPFFDLFIIDESSMLSYTHMSYLQKILSINKNKNYKIVFVGDSNQLPSIGLGDIFYNMQRDKNIPKYNLTINNRSGDNIIKLLDILKNNNRISFKEKIFECENIKLMDHEYFINNIHRIYKENKEIQCLSRRKINYPKDNSNMIESKIFLKIQEFYKNHNDNRFELNDRIYNKKNIYFKDINIMNGFTGTIIKIEDYLDLTLYFIKFDNPIKTSDYNDDSENIMIYYSYNYENIDYHYDKHLSKDENEKNIREQKNKMFDSLFNDYLTLYLNYEEKDKWVEECNVTKNLDFSYILTVHKFQGSECESIIFYLDRTELWYGIDKKLFYTALSRAKKNLYIVLGGIPNSFLTLKENEEILYHNDVF